MEDQCAIADFLDFETARIDQVISKKDRFVQLASEKWEATLDLLICGPRLQVGRNPDGSFVLRGVPEGWSIQPLKHLADPMRPITYGIVLPGPNMPEGPLIVKGGDVKPGRLHPDLLCRTTPEIEASYSRSRLKAGDLVIAIRGGIGDIELVPAGIEGANLTQDAARIAPRSGVSAEWLRYALMSPSVFAPLEASSAGAAVRGINIFDLKRVKIPTPNIQEQREIASEAARAEGQISRLRTLALDHRSLLTEFRSSLVTDAVAGRVDPSQWRRRGQTERGTEGVEASLAA